MNGDGWDDLLLCGDKRTILYVPTATASSTRTALRRAAEPVANGARDDRLSGDGIETSCWSLNDLVCGLGTPTASSGRRYLMSRCPRPRARDRRRRRNGTPDIYAVDGCDEPREPPDLLLLNQGTAGPGRRLTLPALPPGSSPAAAIRRRWWTSTTTGRRTSSC